MRDTPAMSEPLPPAAPYSTRRRVLVAGTTGVVGARILQALLDDPTVAQVHALVRRPVDLSHAKLKVYAVDFAHLPPLPPLDEACLAIGTTIKAAGSQNAFRAVDLGLNLAVAHAAVAAGARRLGVVSAVDADARSKVFYNRVKGELEDALRALDLDALVIARPSLLLDDRRAVGQPLRLGEALAIPLARVVGRFTPGRYRPVAGEKVARALVHALPRTRGERVLASDEMADAPA
jgi:uncharacterized protein YbjT (DUF2867 family)